MNTPSAPRRRKETRLAIFRRSLPLIGPRRLRVVPVTLGLAAATVLGAGAASLTPGGAASEGSVQSMSRLSAAAGAARAPDHAALLATRSSALEAVSRDAERQLSAGVVQQQLRARAQQQMHRRNAALARLARAADRRAQVIAMNRWVLPTSGYQLTAGFGQVSGLWSTFHTGQDFAAPEGTPIVAVTRGTIVRAGYEGSYGYKTVQRLPDGTVLWYCHQSSINVTPGQQVVPGQVIGAVGSTGNVTGAHLHLEVHPGGGAAADPMGILLAHGLRP